MDAEVEEDRQSRESSSFLAYKNEDGHVVDFHALRNTFITNLTRSGVTPKTAQLLARHSDINLTMNTYTMLGVMDQAAAVEALPPIPPARPLDTSESECAAGDGPTAKGGTRTPEKVPSVVPRGAEIGAVRPHRRSYGLHQFALLTA